MRNRLALPKSITRPILLYYQAHTHDDRIYLCYPNGRVEVMEVGVDALNYFSSRLALNHPGQGWAAVREVFMERQKDQPHTEWNPLPRKGWKRLHWELL